MCKYHERQRQLMKHQLNISYSNQTQLDYLLVINKEDIRVYMCICRCVFVSARVCVCSCTLMYVKIRASVKSKPFWLLITTDLLKHVKRHKNILKFHNLTST